MPATRRQSLKLALAAGALPFSIGRNARAQQARELMLYTAMPAGDADFLTGAFEAETGIRVKVWRSSSEQVVQRVIAETRAGRQAFDLVDANIMALDPMRRADALQPLAPLLGQALRSEVTPPHGLWTGTRMSVFCCAWNTSLVAAEELPSGYADLANPRWSRRIAFESDNHGWFATMHAALGHETAARLFDAIAANGIMVRKGHSLIANLMAAGEIPLSLHVYNYRATQLERSGAPVRHRFLSPSLVNATAVAIAAGTQRAADAARYVRFLQSTGQALMAQRGYLPALRAASEAQAGPGRLIEVDPLHLSGETGRQWRRRYEAFLRAGTAAAAGAR